MYFSEESLSSLKLDDNDKGDCRTKGARKPLTTFKGPLLNVRYSMQSSLAEYQINPYSLGTPVTKKGLKMYMQYGHSFTLPSGWNFQLIIYPVVADVQEFLGSR